MHVREDWVGIRGVVGDDSTVDVLKGVTIKSMKRTINVVTDSQGRFEFSLPKRERTSLTLSRDGYVTKPFVVPMDSANSADVVVLMKRGADPIFMKFVRKGIILDRPGVFLDRQPSNTGVLHDLKVADVEMVEVWGRDTDATRTFASRWPGGSIGLWGGGGPWISIWRRR